MKAIVYTKYGPPETLQLNEIEKPAPSDNEILVKIHATTVNRTDCATIRAIPFFARIITGLLRPKKKIPGTSFAGEVEETGIKVSSFKAGDEVFAFHDEGLMAHAQYTAVPEKMALTMPIGTSFEEAAAVMEGAHYAYNFINKVDIKKGQKILVNGATGAIGSAAVQLLKNLEASVTAVCETKGIDLVKSLGAKRIIDYTKSDFTTDNEKYDYIFDTVGKSSFFKCKHLLNPGGVYISSDLGFMAQNLALPLVTPLIKHFIGNKITIFPNPVDIRGSMLLVKKLIEQERFKAVIDRKYPFEQIIDAYKYVEKGNKKGNVVITVEHDHKE